MGVWEERADSRHEKKRAPRAHQHTAHLAGAPPARPRGWTEEALLPDSTPPTPPIGGGDSHHFGLEAAPVGECILLSQGYGLDLNELRGPRGLLVKAGGSDPSTGSGRTLRLARWEELIRLGHPHPGGVLPLRDVVHRLLWLWAAGDTVKLRAYIEDRGLAQNDLFWAVAQAVLKMSTPRSKERVLLEVLVAGR